MDRETTNKLAAAMLVQAECALLSAGLDPTRRDHLANHASEFVRGLYGQYLNALNFLPQLDEAAD